MTLVFRLSSCAGLFLMSGIASAGVLVVQVSDASGKALADTVISAEPEAGPGPKSIKPAEIEQRGLKFLPLVSVIQTGSRVSFPNNDKVKHHIYSFSPAKKFDQKLYSGVAATPQVFDKAGTVVLGCNIHDRMVAYVRIVDTPYFAKTDAAGVARIELPAAGRYTVSAWHYNMAAPAAAADQVASVGAGETALGFRIATKPAALDEGASGKPN